MTASISRLAWLSIAALMLALLAGCDNGNDGAITVSLIDPGDEAQQIGRKFLSPGARQLRMAQAQGLVRYDDEGQIVPGLAQRWVVTDDGLSYIFRLHKRDWSDGKTVTAQDVARGLNERIAIEKEGRFSAEMMKVRDVIARTRQVVEVRLDSPSPSFLTILALPEMGVRTDDQGTGPFALTAPENGNGDDEEATAAGPFWLDLSTAETEMLDEEDAAAKRRVFLTTDRAALAIQRFRNSQSDIVLGGRFQHLPLVNVSGIARSRLQLDPVAGLFGLEIVNHDGFLSDPVNREALAMAIDRSDLFSGLQLTDWTATTRLIPENITDYQPEVANRWSESSIAERRAIARVRVLIWEEANGPVQTLRVAMPEGPGARYLTERLRTDWRLIGIKIEAVAMDAEADLRLIDEVAPYGQAEWYLARLSCVHLPLCDEEADFVLQDARAAYDSAKRSAGIARAETLMTQHNGYIPLGLPLRWSLVRGDIPGYAPNATGLHPLWPLVLDPIS
ncbi:ABC transporter substrate-binding protein [Alterisphingorhabdus coralli]|uniref:ABC transporter substrate-binding protein n=1 Tax=Alterisphingorhabdus coralli TaxID=3071408 RepID=A0AA97I169_9SPHN|nr:ABC transporter substrate-binding protein [Parasphingorhabdus sp. SCSIO 66989]WOE74970.1 ABC transporter substrate-binding protein [Parasphingorhabdus sp. SCSIO 66989]